MSGEMHVVGTKALLRCLPSTGMKQLETLLRTSSLVTVDDAVDALWGHDPDGGPDDAAAAIRVKISRLRKRGLPVRRTPRGYWLDAA